MAFNTSIVITEWSPLLLSVSNSIRAAFTSRSQSRVRNPRSAKSSSFSTDSDPSSLISILQQLDLSPEQAQEACDLMNIAQRVASSNLDEINLEVCLRRLSQIAKDEGLPSLLPGRNLHLTPTSFLVQTRRGFKSERAIKTGSYSGLGSKTVGLRGGSRSPGGLGLTTSKLGQPGNNTIGIGSIFQRPPETPIEKTDLKDIMNKSEDPKTQSNFVEAYRRGIAVSLNHTREERRREFYMRLLYRSAFWGLVFFITYRLYESMHTSGQGGGISRLLDNPMKWDKDDQNLVSDKRFADVVGCDEAKRELEDVVDFLKNPHKFQDIGARLPRGILLVGSPGVGKTLMAKAVAGEAGVPFFQASGSEFDEVFVGVGAMRLRQLFDKAKMQAPCIIFIDEIDTVGGRRVSSPTHPYANQTVNQLLNEMDGFESNDSVIVIGATNFADNLDKALLRPGRFDMQVQVHLPDRDGRIGLLRLYLGKVSNEVSDDEVEQLADMTMGMSGADIDSMVNQGAVLAALAGARSVFLSHMQEAYDKVSMGTERPRVKLESVNENTAAHEAGHTIINLYTDGAPPLNKVTILPRGMSLGHTAFRTPESRQYSQSKKEMLAHMDVCMGGRLGEEMIFGTENVTSGASNDFQQATVMAEVMVKKAGMSDKIGPRSVSNSEKKVSQHLKKEADAEVDRLLKESYARSKKLLQEKAEEHRLLTAALIKYETLDEEDVRRVVKGLPPRRVSQQGPSGPQGDDGKPKKTSTSTSGGLLGWLPKTEDKNNH